MPHFKLINFNVLWYLSMEEINDDVKFHYVERRAVTYKEPDKKEVLLC
jgi:hypothetical protein